MSGPASVRDTGMGLKRFGEVRLGFFNQFLQLRNLAYFLESADFVLLVTINGKACRIVATILESRKT